MRCYEEIAVNFMNHNKMEFGPDTPFFINGSLTADGKPMASIYPNCTPLDMTAFCQIVGVPRATSHIFRKLFSRYLYAQRSVLLREAQEYTACHSNATTRTHYLGDCYGKVLAVLGSSWYQTAMVLPEGRIRVSSAVFASSEQAEREVAGRMQVRDKVLQDEMNMDLRRTEAKKLSKERFLDDNLKLAILEAIVLSVDQGIQITRRGNMMDIFMTGKAILNKMNARALLRLVTMLPSFLLPMCGETQVLGLLTIFDVFL